MQPIEPELPSALRVRAEGLLRAGAAPASQGFPAGNPALNMLHDMAVEPASASSALKLLHELQVYQVELDLQQEHTEHNRQLLTEALERYIALFDQAPFGYLTLDAEGHVLTVNSIGATWLGIARGEWPGPHAQTCFIPAGRLLLQAALARLYQGSLRESFKTQTNNGTKLQAVLTSAAARSAQVLMAVLPAD